MIIEINKEKVVFWLRWTLLLALVVAVLIFTYYLTEFLAKRGLERRRIEPLAYFQTSLVGALLTPVPGLDFVEKGFDFRGRPAFTHGLRETVQTESIFPRSSGIPASIGNVSSFTGAVLAQSEFWSDGEIPGCG